MRSIPLLTLASLALAMPAMAEVQPNSQDLPVTGSVPQLCSLQPGRIASGGLNNIAGLDGNTLRIIQFVDPSTLSVRAASATITFDAVCNFPHAVRIESQNNGMWPINERADNRPAGFAYAVPYTADVSWGPVNTQFVTDAKVRSLNDQSIVVNDPVAGELTLHLRIEDGASNVETRAPLVAGTYVDTVRIFLEPR
jgi:hypothetical protein